MTAFSDSDIDRLLNEAEIRLSTKPQNATLHETARNANNYTLSLPASGHMTKSLNSKPKDCNLQPRIVRPQDLRLPQRADTAGSDWFHMPKTNLTTELKRDLQLITMRQTLAAGKQHFRKNTLKAALKYCQSGVLRDGKPDWLRGTREKKQPPSLVGNALHSDHVVQHLKKQYGRIQATKVKGKNGKLRKSS
ncbi:hypothetical protein QBC40DRAFT_12579 [Triangularia verruculosa]|uniref:Fcf2 pre-rRNA processing C-terminal domain-containing protein n=1 Tax=Triangularia verruculosa TaxID=2587418 RepID=A0AAN7B0D4_9PEZI|nr:hypothetical protein QBC40DRAFT_12579 [Triangularia verruculosa]